VVVVTGASSGIGRACARVFAEEGARVVIGARRGDLLAALESEIRGRGGECVAVVTDVADRAQVYALRDAALQRFGRVDVWINNAGYGMAAAVEQTSPEEMEAIWRVNYMGAFHGCQAALEPMRRQGDGHIVNVSSLAGRYAMPMAAAYSATKAALSALSESLDIELEGTGIRVTSAWVSFTETEFFGAMVKKIPDGSPTKGPVASADDVARRIVRCVKRPRTHDIYLPLPRLILAVSDLFPGLYRRASLWYVRRRVGKE
jgi:NAD(P)-dependent dehydrogenase (short-subunit alcohol dehydrogenase family)